MITLAKSKLVRNQAAVQGGNTVVINACTGRAEQKFQLLEGASSKKATFTSRFNSRCINRNSVSSSYSMATDCYSEGPGELLVFPTTSGSHSTILRSINL